GLVRASHLGGIRTGIASQRRVGSQRSPQRCCSVDQASLGLQRRLDLGKGRSGSGCPTRSGAGRVSWELRQALLEPQGHIVELRKSRLVSIVEGGPVQICRSSRSVQQVHAVAEAVEEGGNKRGEVRGGRGGIGEFGR